MMIIRVPPRWLESERAQVAVVGLLTVLCGAVLGVAQLTQALIAASGEFSPSPCAPRAPRICGRIRRGGGPRYVAMISHSLAPGPSQPPAAAAAARDQRTRVA